MFEWLNIKEFMNDYKEWHAFVEGFCEAFYPEKAEHELTGALAEDLAGEHHYYVFGRVVGYIAHILFHKLVGKMKQVYKKT